jgi:hypothetical protein
MMMMMMFATDDVAEFPALAVHCGCNFVGQACLHRASDWVQDKHNDQIFALTSIAMEL